MKELIQEPSPNDLEKRNNEWHDYHRKTLRIYLPFLKKIKKYSVRGVVDKVTTKEIVSYKPGDLDTDSNISITKKVAILDVGTKFNIARCLLKRGCEVTIYPARTKAETILASHPDGIMLTNGPGDPKECTEVIEELKKTVCIGYSDFLQFA